MVIFQLYAIFTNRRVLNTILTCCSLWSHFFIKNYFGLMVNKIKNFISSSIRQRLFILFNIFTLASCISIGPGRVHMDRGTYNNIVRETDQEQLLTNIVRQRYLEVTQYIQVASLTASYSLSQSLAGNVSATTAPTSWTSSLSPTVSYSDTPTISYIPLSNIEFAKSLMSPVSMNDFLLLAHAGGYDHAMLYSLFFEQIGDVNSDLLHKEGREYITPGYIKFHQITETITKLYRQGAFLTPSPVVFEKNLGCLLSFKNNQQNSADALKLQKLLNIPLHSKEIVFLEHSLLGELENDNGVAVLSAIKNQPENVVFVRLRSVYAMLSIVSRGVLIPCQDKNANLTREVFNQDGSRYDWRHLGRRMLIVHASDKEPREETLVRIRSHNHWFYIKASDQMSKDTFDALLRILTLTSAVAASTNSMPVLTIPVASSGK